MNSEPALIVSAVVTLLNAVVSLMVAHGTLSTSEGVAISSAITAIGALFIRQNVTSNNTLDKMHTETTSIITSPKAEPVMIRTKSEPVKQENS